jgi:hypothetical protein
LTTPSIGTASRHEAPLASRPSYHGALGPGIILPVTNQSYVCLYEGPHPAIHQYIKTRQIA